MSETPTADAAIRPGQRVRISKRIERREGDWTLEVEGVVEQYAPDWTGSWFAHGKNDKLWLNRILIRKDDGELSDVIVDRFTRVEILSENR